LFNIQMLPAVVFMVRTACRAETSISDRVRSGEMASVGLSKSVSAKGSPIGVPRSGSNRTPQRLRYDVEWRERK
jgi:hypothetical protein